MREIKFRGWHIPSKTWLTSEECLSIIMLQGRTISKQADGTDLLERHDIMQYTGLKDRNGVEIYEGDILRHIGENYVGSVTFLCGCFMTECRGWGDECVSDVCEEMIEITGNIHQNPELLK